MTVYQLTPEQLFELKQAYLMETMEEAPDYYTLANADDYVSDEEVFEYYKHFTFSDDDFGFDASAAREPIRIIINVHERQLADLAISEVSEAVKNGDKRGYLTYCDFEVQER